jgi:hypothetical protein
VWLLKEWLVEKVLKAHETNGGYRIAMTRMEFKWSDVSPDCLIIRGILGHEQSFKIPGTRTARRPGPEAADDDGGECEEDDGDVPDFGSFVSPAGPGAADDVPPDEGVEVVAPADLPEELVDVFDPCEDPPNPDFPPPVPAGDHGSSSDSSSDTSDSSSDTSEAAAGEEAAASSVSFDKDLYSKDPGTCVISMDAAEPQGKVFEVLADGSRGRMLGSIRPVGTTSAKVKCNVCEKCPGGRPCRFLIAGDMAWEEMDEELHKWFQMAAAAADGGGVFRAHHHQQADELRQRIKALRRQRKA